MNIYSICNLFIATTIIMIMTAGDCKTFNRNSKNNILKYNQVRRLDGILNETLIICGECGLPTISVTVKDFILAVKHKLEIYQVPMLDMRLNGGAAAAVLDPYQALKYNDIDILIILDSSQIEDDDDCFSDTIKAVLEVIYDLLQPMSENTLKLFQTQKLSYIHKLVKVQNPDNGDSWSLLGLGYNGNFDWKSCRIDLKFTHRMKRQYEFSIDSFQIILDSLLIFYEALSKFSLYGVYINKNFYPTVYVNSKWLNLADALIHLRKRYIITSEPENIRGGGLLKYCKLLVQNFTVPENSKTHILERYMCSRFFIDYIDLPSQRKVILSYLKNHFKVNEAKEFLETLKRVISHSSVCLMNKQRQQTISLIEQISLEINSQFYLHFDQYFMSKSNNSFSSDLKWSVDEVLDGIILPNHNNFKFKEKLQSHNNNRNGTLFEDGSIILSDYHNIQIM